MRVRRPLQRRYRRGYAANLIVLAVTIPSAAFFSTAYRRVLASPGSLRAFQQSSLGSLTTVQRNPKISLREGKRSVSSERSNLACGADVSAKEAGSGAKAAGGGPWGRVRIVNTFRELPRDPEDSNQRRQVEAAYSDVEPTPVKDPKLILHSSDLLCDLGLTESDAEDPEFTKVLAGNAAIPDSISWSMCYGGHQFGTWAGQLGDGRAIVLGEIETTSGDHYELQLKGAGPTPYSRRADGRAVLRSSIREFLCSEYMHHIGVPTTRALSLIGTGEPVARDFYYNGNVRLEPGAVVCRVAPSFLRFGSFQLPFSRGMPELTEDLIEYNIEHDFPHISSIPKQDQRILAWFGEVVNNTAALCAKWQSVGFVHGVLNTDNMSPLGITIDYGPYGFLEGFDPNYTPNLSDQSLRYTYKNQPYICKWNLYALSGAVDSILSFQSEPNSLSEEISGVLEKYDDIFLEKFHNLFGEKLGLRNLHAMASEETKFQPPLLTSLFDLLSREKVDFSLFFRRLPYLDPSKSYESFSDIPGELKAVIHGDSGEKAPEEVSENLEDWYAWFQAYLKEVREQEGEKGVLEGYRSWRDRMFAVNPRIVLRNYYAQEAISLAESGDFTTLNRLYEAVQKPFALSEAEIALVEKEIEGTKEFVSTRLDEYDRPAPLWAQTQPGIAQLS